MKQNRAMTYADTPCIEWQGHILPHGYGTVTVCGKTQLAHRVAYEHANGPIPDGLHVDHLCRNRACVNPRHLEAVTQAENNRRAAAAAETCRRGHNRTEQNTRIEGGKYRRCLDCRDEKRAEDDARKKEWARSNRQKRREIQRAYRARLRAERGAA